jgi:predicted CopG family antitoxin
MTKKLTITVSAEVYEGLYRKVGRRHISRFLERLARPHLIEGDIEAAYRTLAADSQREAEAGDWSEALIGDTAGTEPDVSR